jgi:hypothetical protein
MNIVTVCWVGLLRCHNSAQHVAKVTCVIEMAHLCNSMSGFRTVWRDDAPSKHAVTRYVTERCVYVPQYYISAKHVVQAATIIVRAQNYNSMLAVHTV